MMPCRFAEHSLPDGSFHVDLFVDTDGSSLLETYEIASSHYQILLSCINSGNRLTLSEAPLIEDAVPLIKKNPHRRIYFHFAGEIEQNRGFLKHLNYNEIEKISENCCYLS